MMPTDHSSPPNNSDSAPDDSTPDDSAPDDLYPEVDATLETYKKDSRHKMGPAENFIARHRPQLISLIQSYTFQSSGSDASLEQSNDDHKNFRRFKDAKWMQWVARNSGEATDKRKFFKKLDNIHRVELAKWKQATLASSSPPSAPQPTPRPSNSETQPLHFALTANEVTARSIFNNEQSGTHHELVKQKQREAGEEKRYIGQLAHVRASEWSSLTDKQKAVYASKAEEERQRVFGSREECQDRLLTSIQYLISTAVGNKPGQVGPAGFNIQYYYYNNDGSVVQGGFGLGDCANFEGTDDFRNVMVPTFGSFAKVHVPCPPRVPRYTFKRNPCGIAQLPAYTDEKPDIYRGIMKEYLLTAWDDSYPHRSLDWGEFCQNHAKFLVPGISASAKNWESIDKMKLSDLFLLSENICAHQSANGAVSIFKPAPDIPSTSKGSSLSPQDPASFVEEELRDTPHSQVEASSSLLLTPPPVSIARSPSPPPSFASTPANASQLLDQPGSTPASITTPSSLQDAASFVEEELRDTPHSQAEASSSLLLTPPPISVARSPSPPPSFASTPANASQLLDQPGSTPASITTPSSPISATSVINPIRILPPSPGPLSASSTPEPQTEPLGDLLPRAATPQPVSTPASIPNSPSASITAVTPPPRVHTPLQDHVSTLPGSPLTPECGSSPLLPSPKKNKRKPTADTLPDEPKPASKKARRQGRVQSINNMSGGGSTRRSGRQRKEVVQGALPALAAPQATKCKHSWYYITVDAEGRPVTADSEGA